MALSRRRKIFLFGPLVLLLALVGVVLVKRHLAIRELEAFKAELTEHGAVLAIDQLTPQRDDASIINADVLKLIEQVNSLIRNYGALPMAMEELSPGWARVASDWPQWPVYGGLNNTLRKLRPPDSFLNPERRHWYYWVSWDVLATNASSRSNLIERVRAYWQAPQAAFAIDYNQRFEARVPHLTLLRALTHGVVTLGLADLYHDELDEAVNRVRMLRRMCYIISHDQFLWSHYTRFNIDRHAYCLTWEILQHELIDASHLDDLAKIWTPRNVFPAVGRALLMERAVGHSSIPDWRKDVVNISQAGSLFGASWDLGNPRKSSIGRIVTSVPGGRTILRFLDTTGHDWYSRIVVLPYYKLIGTYEDEAEYLDQMSHLIEVTKSAMLAEQNGTPLLGPQRSYYKEAERWIDGFHLITPYHPFSRNVIRNYGFDKVVDRSINTMTRYRLVETAIAVKQYQLSMGAYPKSLSEIVPRFLSSLPLDPWENQPFRYEFEPSLSPGFLLYSPGKDGLDDRLRRPRKATDSRDDVYWPRQATPMHLDVYHRMRVGGEH